MDGLKPAENLMRIYKELFTFQYGWIKTTVFDIHLPWTTQFTFQYGQIKTVAPDTQTAGTLRFTFQYGQIKTRCRTGIV